MADITLIDTQGRPLAMIGEGNPHQGARMDRELRTWNPRLRSADADLLRDWPTLVARTHDLVRNHGMLSGGVQIHLDAVIGSGLRLAAKPDYRALGQSSEWAAEWGRNTESEWRQYAEDIDRYCDAGRRLTIAHMLGQAYRCYLTTGDITASAEWLPGRGGRYATAIQMIDPPRVCNPGNAADDDRLRAGVELDGYGAPVAYHIRQSMAGDPGWLRGLYEWRRVPRQTPWGRTQFIHIYDPQQPGQTRGRTGFASIIARSKMLDRFQGAGLEAAIVNAMYAAVIESDFDHSQVVAAMGQTDEALSSYVAGMAEFYAAAPVKLDGVKIPHLYPGEKLTFTSANHPSPNYADYERGVLRHLAAGLNLSYEELARDYSQTNYSGARAGMMQSWRFFTARRDLIGGAFASQIYALWLEEAMEKGIVETPGGAPDFWDAKTAWTRCRWIGPKQGNIDPLKESKADLLEMDANLMTLEDACAARGVDWEENLEQCARELVRRRELESQYGIQFADSVAAGIAGAPDAGAA